MGWSNYLADLNRQHVRALSLSADHEQNWWQFLLIPLLIGIVGITSCARQTPTAPTTLKVTVNRPHLMTVTNWDEYPGHLEAVEQVEVRPRVTGYLDSIHFQDGAEVKAGDRLFVIDPRPYQAEWERARAERQRSETHLELASNDLHRAESLRANDSRAISVEEYDSRHKAVREAQAALRAVMANEEASKLNLDYTEIKAPINGRIGRRLVTVGNLVQMQGNGGAATVLATIVPWAPIYCYFDADERAFLQYRGKGNSGNNLGQTNLDLLCELKLDNEEGFPHQGHVDFVDNQVNARSGTIRLRAVFANQDRTLVPGLFAMVRVPAGPPAEVLVIPDVAIGSDQGRKYVYVVGQNNTIETRPITSGRAHGQWRDIVTGLSQQDLVVVNGLMQVRPGIKVNAQEGPPTGAATPVASNK